jgi:hypothetical protein
VRFLLDHNVLGSVQGCLERHGHDVEWSRDVVGQEAEDQVVATAAMDAGQILVSHDNDMRRVQRFLSEAHRERFPTLSRLMFQCDQATSLERLEFFMPLIEFELDHARNIGHPFLLHIQARRAVIIR